MTTKYITDLQGIGICDIDIQENENDNVLCLCNQKSNNIAYDCKGCLKCTNLDCAYYIQNMIETFMQIHHVDIYVQN